MKQKMMKKQWNEYLWIWTIIYFGLGFFNIFFAWLGMIDFFVPLLFAIFGGNKLFCNSYCGRGQLYRTVGSELGFSRNRPVPKWIYSKYFRNGFLIFFMTMFSNMIYRTYLVAANVRSVGQFVKLFWTFRVPWHFAYNEGIGVPWMVQFSYGLYSIMLTSALLGFIVMVMYKPRTWCGFCPMGTMTQEICKIKNRTTK